MGSLKWVLRQSLRPGDLGYLIHLHGVIYAKEYAFDTKFEAYVASGIADFIQSFNPKKDRIWLAEVNRRIVGSIAIVERTKHLAQLRWYLVHPDYRGQGIGKRLIGEALRFCKRAKYERIFLWTTSELDSARHLYLEAGFKKSSSRSHKIWGKKIREERYELHL